MTRSHKANDRDHAGLADGTAPEEQYVPRYFAKSGHADADPTKTKKNGGGKGNWGREGDELQDYGYNLTNPRRRSNSSSTGHHASLRDFKTKFETVEPDPVFEEELHGPGPAGRFDEEDAEAADGAIIEKQSTVSSTDSAPSSAISVGDEEAAKRL